MARSIARTVSWGQPFDIDMLLGHVTRLAALGQPQLAPSAPLLFVDRAL